MEKQLVVIQNVRGYCDEQGTAWLNAEDVARKLGFVQVHKERVTTGGYNCEAVRWERVNGYLREFADIGKENSNGEPVENLVEVKAGDYIPEQTAYLLAMKANNEVAKTFQWKLANEVIPAIRKTGSYSLKKEEPKPELNPQITPVACAMMDVKATKALIQEMFAVKDGIAFCQAIDAVGKKHDVPIEGLKELAPPAEHETGYLNATRIGEKLGGIKPQFVNRLLEKGSFLYKDGKHWRLTDKGKEFGEEMPYTRNGHSGHQIRWHESIVAQVRAVLAQAA